jgi:hypothetical protein
MSIKMTREQESARHGNRQNFGKAARAGEQGERMEIDRGLDPEWLLEVEEQSLGT